MFDCGAADSAIFHAFDNDGEHVEPAIIFTFARYRQPCAA